MRCFSSAMVSLLIVTAACPVTAQKKPVTSIGDLPRFSYPYLGDLTLLFDDPARFEPIAAKAEADIRSTLADYDIRDPATLRRLHGALVSLAQYRRDWPAVRREVAIVRSLHDKPLNKAISGDWNLAYAEAADFEKPGSAAFPAAFRKSYQNAKMVLPWSLYGDMATEYVGTDVMVARSTLIADALSSYQSQVDKGGALDERAVRSLADAIVTVRDIVPLKAQFTAADRAYLAVKQAKTSDIWQARDLVLPAGARLTPVVVAIWDGGVDAADFPRQMWSNPREMPNGKDDDGNGYVDDIHGIAVDENGARSTSLMLPLPSDLRPRLREAQRLTIGQRDQLYNIDSADARAFTAFLDKASVPQLKSFFNDQEILGGYSHGSHVAGIAARGNPAIRLLSIRRSFAIGDPPRRPTEAIARAYAQDYADAVAYMKAAGVRVVNMSWGVDVKTEYENQLAANGVAEAERATEAKRLFAIEAQGLRDAIASASDILFVCAAGNANDSAAFSNTVPASIDAANVITVAAVAADGRPTSFTTTGPTVDVAANGYRVLSNEPDGLMSHRQGTSMASPQVVNVAAKLLAINPKLTVDQLRDLLLSTATPGETGFRLLNGHAALTNLESAR